LLYGKKNVLFSGKLPESVPHFARFFTVRHFRAVSKSGRTGAFNSKFACPSILLHI